MSDAFWLIVACLLNVSGMAWLALAMDVHWGQVMHRHADEALGTRQRLRWLGAMALPGSLWACLVADRPSIAALVWIMLLAGAALSVAWVLTWHPRWLRVFVPGDRVPSV